MTLNQLISTFRNTIKVYTDDTVYTDQALAEILTLARAAKLNQVGKTFSEISRANYQRVCVKLCNNPIFDCPVNFDKVLRSTDKLPAEVYGRNSGYLKVYTLDGAELHQRDLGKKIRYINGRATYDILNDYLILENMGECAMVVVDAIFENPMEVAEFSCNDEPCFDPSKSEYPIESGTKFAILNMAIKMLGLGESFNPDNDDINNSQADNE